MVFWLNAFFAIVLEHPAKMAVYFWIKPLSSKPIPIKKDFSQRRQVALSKSTVLILGSSAISKCLTRNLKQAGVNKIQFLNQTSLQSAWSLANIEKLVRQSHLIIDVLSDWQRKISLSDICMDCDKVLIHSGITGFRFQIYTMTPGRSACLRCALPLAGIDEIPLQPPKEKTIDSVIELVAAWQSLEAVKCLAAIGVTQGNELFKFDCLSGEFEIIRGLDANPDCPDCGRKIKRRSRH